MATPRKRPEDKLKTGAPSKYKPEFCAALIEHYKAGNSFESFGSVAGVSIATMYNWLEAHPEFLEARNAGIPHLHRFYEQLGRTIATGQLRRLKAEVPMLDHNGAPIVDAQGGLVYRKEYEPATPAQAVWIFMTKNMLGWRDRRDIGLHGGEDPKTGKTKPIAFEAKFKNMSKADVQKRYQELLKKAVETAVEGEDDDDESGE